MTELDKLKTAFRAGWDEKESQIQDFLYQGTPINFEEGWQNYLRRMNRTENEQPTHEPE